MRQELLEIGKITSTHGLKGEVKVEVWCDSIEVLKKIPHLYFNKDDKRKVLSVKQFKGMAIILLEGICDIDSANKLRGKILYAHRNDIQKDEDSFFIVDLIGMTVKEMGSNKVYGKIIDVQNTGANDIYYIEKDGKVSLIPAIPQVVKSINLEENEMQITALEGLFDED